MKRERHEKILEIIRRNDITTQGELVSMLRQQGYDVTQATISRDIRELGLNKRLRGGKFVYMPHDAEAPGQQPVNVQKFTQVFQNAFVSAQTAGNLVVVRTLTGMAMAAAASLDSMKLPQIVGCVAGDDTIFVALKTPEDAEHLKDEFLHMVR